MSAQTKQKEAVFSAVSSVINEAGVTVNEGESFSTHLNRELRAQVTNILVEGFNSGTIVLDKSFSSDAELRTYCSGLTSNWLRKDPRLNGNVKYAAKNPGSRVGSSDAQLKAMRALLSTKTDIAEKAEIQSFIDARVSEIKSSRKPAKSIDVSALPEELQHLVNN
ncbi:unnamed protein product [Sphagnum balticum]